jgi:hypothetical protein
VRRWADYDLLDEIGRGAFGTVYRAFHPTLRQHVALKLIGVPTGNPRDVEKALDEPRRLAAIRHEHVVAVHDARYVDGYVGICMELVRGETLAQTIARGVRLGADETVALGTTLCRALSAIHRAELIHSDVKAHNVMREDGGRIVLMDFGAGRRLIDPEQTTGRFIVGTPAYMAPELFGDGEPSPGSDIYSLGVLLFFVLTGEYPVEATSLPAFAAAHARHSRRYLADLRDDVPVRLLQVVDRALQPSPADRYRTAGEMLLDLTVRTTQVQESRDLDAGREIVRQLPRPDVLDAGTVDDTSTTALVWLRQRLAAAAASLLAFVWVLGYASTKAYAVMFGLTGEFGSESPFVWLDVGTRTLPLMLFFLVDAVVVFVMVRFVWRMLTRASARVNAWSERTTRRVDVVTRRVGLNDLSTVASAVVIAQLIALVAAYFAFHPLIEALTMPLIYAPLDVHSRLGRWNENEWLTYRAVTSVLAVTSGAAWLAILRRQRRGSPGGTTVIGGLALTAVFVAMSTVPWRIVHQSSFQIAQYGSLRCFIVSERLPRVMLFCPENAGSRSVVVTEPDSKLTRLARYENIFDGIAPREASRSHK